MSEIEKRACFLRELVGEEHPDRHSFWMALEQSPDDVVTLAAFSDHLEESSPNGWHDLAFALRWMAKSGRHPVRRADVKRFPWVLVRAGAKAHTAVRLARALPSAVIPPVHFDCHPNRMCRHNPTVDFRRHRHAVIWLAASLIPLRFLVGLPEHLPTIR